MDKSKETISALALKSLQRTSFSRIGLGSGSTVKAFISQLECSDSKFIIIPTSVDSEIHSTRKKFCLRIEHFDTSCEVAIDGADEVERSTGYLIKGGGAALTREKIVAYAAEQFWILADASKIVEKLGSTQPIPIEVLSFGWKETKHQIEKLGGECTLRAGTGKLGPIITDNGNFILDFSTNLDWDPQELERKINLIPGVIENGIFTRPPDKIFIGKGENSEIMTFQQPKQSAI